MSPDDEAYDPFDAPALQSGLADVFYPVVDHYFRPRLLGAQRLPSRGPLVLAANHSGSAFPWDAMVLDALIWRRDGFGRSAKFRSVYEKELSQYWWMRPFGIDDFWRRGGGVDLTFDNFDHLLARGERVAYYPEGVPGIGKGFQRRYQLQRFSTSFVLLAARNGAPVVPVHIINAEYVLPLNFTLKPVDRMMERVFGVPFFPLPFGVLGIIFPWTFYLALPARMVFVVGDALDMRELLRQEGVTDLDRPDRSKLKRVAERVRRTMQVELDRNVERYGRRPYNMRSLRRALERARRRGLLGRVLPTNWAVTFNRMDRNRRRPAARGLRAALRDWDLLAFYVPFGWPLLSLIRRMRHPPCGYRGLSPEERREMEGRFVWRLHSPRGSPATADASDESRSSYRPLAGSR